MFFFFLITNKVFNAIHAFIIVSYKHIVSAYRQIYADIELILIINIYTEQVNLKNICF